LRGSIRRRLEKIGIDDFGVKIKQDSKLIEIVKVLREQGMSYQKIAEQFNRNEINTRSGVGKWFGKTVRDIGAITRW